MTPLKMSHRNIDESSMSRTRGTTLATVAVGVALVAFVTAIAVAAVMAPHHKHAATATSDKGPLTNPQRRSFAQQLNAARLPAGVTHTTVCPQKPSDYDACFAATTPITATSGSLPVKQLLAAVGVDVQSANACGAASGGPSGKGMVCLAIGTWHGAPVSALAFSPTGDNKRNIPKLDVLVTVAAQQTQ
jgi:hypothetical protein